MSPEPAEESIIVKGTAEQLPEMFLESIRQTYNSYAEKVNDNPKWTMNMTTYCKDVGFLLGLVYKYRSK